MIGLASQTYSSTGYLVLHNADASSNTTDRARRVTRTATLDGGSVITDGGACVGDRTLKIQVERPTRAQADLLAWFADSCPRVTVTTPEGVFSAYVSDYTYNNGTATLTCYVLELR